MTTWKRTVLLTGLVCVLGAKTNPVKRTVLFHVVLFHLFHTEPGITWNFYISGQGMNFSRLTLNSSESSQPLRDPRQITSVMLNRFWSLSKNPFTPSPSPHLSFLFIMDNIRLHGMPTTSFEKVLLWKVTRYSYQFFSCFTSVFISADIIFTTF